MSFADYLEDAVLDHIFQNTAFPQPPDIYIGLSTADPTDDASGLAEPSSGFAYARVQHNSWSVSSGGSTSNSGTVTFAEATGSWGTITHFAIFDGPGATDNMLVHGSLTTSKAITVGDTASFANGELTINLD